MCVHLLKLSIAFSLVSISNAKADCGIPTGLLSLLTTYNSTQIKWNGDPYTTDYQVQWRQAGQAEWDSVWIPRGVNLNQQYLSSLETNKTYEWRVRARCSPTELSQFSEIATFETACQVFNVRMGPQQHNQLTPSSALVFWASNEPYATYDLEIKSESETSWRSIKGITFPIEPLNYRITDLTLNSVYQWRVRPVCSPTVSGSFADGPSFQTLCKKPKLPTSHYEGTSESVVLEWDGSPEENYRYTLQWKPVGQADWNTLSDVQSRKVELKGLPNNRRFEWQLQRHCQTGSVSAVSGFQAMPDFYTFCNPAPPGSFRTQPNRLAGVVLSWPESYSIYRIQWRQQGATDWIDVIDPPGSSYELTNLAYNTPYEWRVSLLCGAGVYSDFINASPFTVTCPAPSSVEATHGSYNATLISWRDRWQTNAYIGRYTLQWREKTATDWITISNLSDGSHLLENLPLNKTYEARLQAHCHNGVRSAFTATQDFAAQCETPSNLGVTVNGSSVLLKWFLLSKALSFTVRWRPKGEGSWNVVSNIQTTTYTLTNLPLGKTYEWTVQAECGAVFFSGQTTGLDFEPYCMAAKALSAVVLTETSARVSWEAPPILGATYTLRWKVDGAFSGSTVSGLTESTTILTGLAPGAAYVCHLVTECPNQPGGNVGAPLQWTQTLGKLPCSGRSWLTVSVQQITSNSAWVHWKQSNPDDAFTYELQYRVADQDTAWTTLAGIQGNAYKLTDLATNQRYSVRVRMRCPDGEYSEYVPVDPFRTECATYIPGWIAGRDSMHLVWSEYASNHLYKVQWKSIFDTNWQSLSGTTSGTQSIGGLKRGEIYQFRYQTLCTSTLR